MSRTLPCLIALLWLVVGCSAQRSAAWPRPAGGARLSRHALQRGDASQVSPRGACATLRIETQGEQVRIAVIDVEAYGGRLEFQSKVRKGEGSANGTTATVVLRLGA